ncbi:hypothetical protein NM688_g830 [Phlebia brevispora]|uniref:Uncharacterized protein n=1 Tax=Phlebia brevispora TaxID=194682 RepID=A0ACC1TDJ6_9APHY|nr:hypothetical protein NM688_g830 [Phlebia brevispora]
MHLVSINLPDLLLKLWRGTLDCDKDDDKATWEWAVLTGEIWKTHGRTVGATKPYLPGSFDRAPRNPAEKVSSGYKAIEFLTYLFGMGPALLEGVLPERYWLNFCKLVRGIRIMHQRVVQTKDLLVAHSLLNEFCEEFEQLYYQRYATRLHFVRYSVHALIHMARETRRIGPYIILSQWTMERVIDQLVKEMRQPSNPYQNLAKRALRRAQISSLLAMCPFLDRSNSQRLPRGASDLGDN